MTDDSRITCPEHGEADTTYVCRHLAENPEQPWFCDSPTEENRWPDAWCGQCDAAFREKGEWNEHNEGATEIALLCHRCYEAGIASSVDAVSDDTRAAWKALVRQCHDELGAKQEQLRAEFALGEHKRWDYDQDTASLMFSNDGVPALIAEVEFIGSVSTRTGTWLWSWANFHLLPNVRSRIAAVRAFGEERGFPRLTVPKWDADEVDGWEVSGIAGKVLGALGVYRVPTEYGFLYMAVMNMRDVRRTQ